MPRTPLLSAVHRLARDVAAESAPPRREISRRTVLKSSLVGLGAAAVSGTASSAWAASGGGPRIVVVGAGLAGLTAAYQLRKAGYAATVFEAADRLGGR